jgi:hypothetical protein
MLSFFEMLNLLGKGNLQEADVIPKGKIAQVDPPQAYDDDDDDGPAVLADPFDGDEDAQPIKTYSPDEPDQAPQQVQKQLLRGRQADRVADLHQMYNQSIFGRLGKSADDMGGNREWRTLLDLAIHALGIKDVNGQPLEVPHGAFEISLNNSRKGVARAQGGLDPSHEELVMGADDFRKAMDWIHEYIGVQQGQSNIERNASFKQALVSKFSNAKNDADKQVVLRALQFEDKLLNFAGRTYTLQSLAQSLADTVGKNLSGGIGTKDENLDQKALVYLIKTSRQANRQSDEIIGGSRKGKAVSVRGSGTTKDKSDWRHQLEKKTLDLMRKGLSREKAEVEAKEIISARKEKYAARSVEPTKVRVHARPFNFFLLPKGADLNDPNTKIRIKSVDEIAEMGKNVEGEVDFANMRIGNKDQAAKAAIAALQRNINKKIVPESLDWENLLDALEYWEN